MLCSYCENLLSENNESQEHIIQNALGGILESTKICCDICNSIVQQEIDDKFCRIFNPVIAQIKNLKKTNKSSMPSCKGRAKYIDGKMYTVIIKNQLVVDCSEYKRLHKKELSKAELRNFEIIDYIFDIDDNIFKQGITKISYNFAIHQGVQKEKINSILKVEKNEETVMELAFESRIIPFIPLNGYDKFLERRAPVDLTHTLILFSHKNYLVCYVDLFNTFQNYVVLSEIWDGGEIYKTYYQVIEKIDRTVPEFNFRRVKHIHTMATIYGVEPTLDLTKLKKDITDVVTKNPYAKDIQEYISNNTPYRFLPSSNYNLGEMYRSISYYLDEDDYLRKNRFRRYTPPLDSHNDLIRFYPIYILSLLKSDNTLNIKQYSILKLNRLNKYLLT